MDFFTKMNIANKITFLRILFVPLVIVFLYPENFYANVTALFLFILISVSDLVDGYLARKYNLITDFGKILDPIADKILLTSIMLVLIQLGRVDAWLVAIIVSRDLLVAAVRDLSSSKGLIIAAGGWGKTKTIFQMIAIGFLMYKSSTVFGIYINAKFIGTILIYISTIMSVYSGFLYIKSFIESSKSIDVDY